MDKSQYEALSTRYDKTSPRIRLDASTYMSRPDGVPKTLLYGYTCDRETHHVFQDAAGEIHLYVYRNNFGSPETPIRMVDVSNEGIGALDELIPDKRLYPQHCDYEFCLYLKERGVHLPFTTWEEPRTAPGQPDSPFRGETYSRNKP